MAIIRMLMGIAMLTSVCALAVGPLLPAPAQPTLDPALANFETDATNPSLLIQTRTNEQRVDFSLNDEFSSSFALLKDYPQTDKSSGLPDIHAGYGQYFPDQSRSRLSISPIEEPSRLYLKVSITF